MFSAETHIRDDYVSGGPELARLTGASCPAPGGARVRFAYTPVGDGGTVTVDAGSPLRATATSGHASCVLQRDRVRAGPPVVDGPGEDGTIA